MTIIYSIIIFCILIFVHELGHFLAAKGTGIRVNEFALGMGPAAFKKQKGETVYSLRIFPIGGFCAMEGESSDSDDEGAFNKKPFYKKALVLAAGSAMNLLLTIVILSGVFLYFGMPDTTLSKVVAGSPAQEAGLLKGDRIVAVDQTPVRRWQEIPAAIDGAAGETITVRIRRGGEDLEIQVAPRANQEGRKVIGIEPGRSRNPAAALKYGTLAARDMGVTMVKLIGQLFTGEVSTKELMGPVGIVSMVGDTARHGFLRVAQLAALISLNLAIVNMLPFPALDGGRLLMQIIRKVTGKCISDEVEGKIHLAGFALLILLMLYVTYQDVLRLFFGARG